MLTYYPIKLLFIFKCIFLWGPLLLEIYLKSDQFYEDDSLQKPLLRLWVLGLVMTIDENL